MVSLRSKPSIDDPFRKNETVKATRDLPGVPVGTSGKIKVIDGFRWLRYWVFFDNGVHIGSIDDDDLVRPAHWDEYFVRQQQQAEQAASQAAVADSTADQAAATSAEIDPNDPMAALLARVPPQLLERSAAARQRLGVPKP